MKFQLPELKAKGKMVTGEKADALREARKFMGNLMSCSLESWLCRDDRTIADIRIRVQSIALDAAEADAKALHGQCIDLLDFLDHIDPRDD